MFSKLFSFIGFGVWKNGNTSISCAKQRVAELEERERAAWKELERALDRNPEECPVCGGRMQYTPEARHRHVYYCHACRRGIPENFVSVLSNRWKRESEELRRQSAALHHLSGQKEGIIGRILKGGR